jgi:hypothetical protein
MGTDVDVPSGRSRIPELSGIEFHGHESVRQYANAIRVLCRDLACELEFGSGELYQVLSRQAGHPLLLGLDVKLRARRVCRRLDRLARLMGGGTTESIAFYMEFRRQFADVIRDKKSRKDPRTFNWEG